MNNTDVLDKNVNICQKNYEEIEKIKAYTKLKLSKDKASNYYHHQNVLISITNNQNCQQNTM